MRHAFLKEALTQRWYAYEQTMVMLLQAVFGRKHIAQFFVGHISDLPGRTGIAALSDATGRAHRNAS